MENPWKDVSAQHPFAECDRDIIFSPKYADKLQIYFPKRESLEDSLKDNVVLPEPYIGNVESNVVCLNGNPGGIDTQFRDNDIYMKLMLATLNHSCKDFLWLSEEMKSVERTHAGVHWWEDRTRQLVRPQLFVLEYFPYHSLKTFNFPKNLPSNKYRNYLLKKAMDAGKLIVIMRCRSLWYDIREDNIGNTLENYDNKIILKNPQNVRLSAGNMKPSEWIKLKKALEQ